MNKDRHHQNITRQFYKRTFHSVVTCSKALKNVVWLQSTILKWYVVLNWMRKIAAYSLWLIFYIGKEEE